MDIPEFSLYGEGDPEIESSIQPKLKLRNWGDLSYDEKKNAFQELKNQEWIDLFSIEVFDAISYLNKVFLRQCPGKNLHKIKPPKDIGLKVDIFKPLQLILNIFL